MRIDTCYFCSGPIYPGHGIQFIRNDSKVNISSFKFIFNRFSNFAEVNVISISRQSITLENLNGQRLTGNYKKYLNDFLGKELLQDKTIEFQQERNTPIVYNRELYQKTIQAMKKIGEIKKARNEQFYINRLKAVKAKQVKDVDDQLQKHIDLLENESEKLKLKELLKEKQKVKKKQIQKLKIGKLQMEIEQQPNDF